MLGSLWISAGQHKDPVGVVRHTGPDLLPVDDELIPILHRPGLQGGQVRAGIGLAIALAPDGVAAENARDMLAFLLLRAVAQERWTKKARGVAADHRGVEVGQLLVKNKLLPEGPLQAAVLLWPGHGQPVARAKFFGKGVGKGKLAVIIRIPELRAAPALGELCLQELPDFLPKGCLFR